MARPRERDRYCSAQNAARLHAITRSTHNARGSRSSTASQTNYPNTLTPRLACAQQHTPFPYADLVVSTPGSSPPAKPRPQVPHTTVHHRCGAGEGLARAAHVVEAALALRDLCLAEREQAAQWLEQAAGLAGAVEAYDVCLQELHHLHTHRESSCQSIPLYHARGARGDAITAW